MVWPKFKKKKKKKEYPKTLELAMGGDSLEKPECWEKEWSKMGGTL